ncbi:MAG TPA: hypothetical protein VKW04_15225, partial [Planctomycetota bacterium]|nr:hypothetical protein [Planctomycetota bacterium]
GTPMMTSYTVNPVNGALTLSSATAPLPTVATASAFAIDPGLNYAYVVDGSAAGAVQSYTLSGTGALTALGAPVSTGTAPTTPVGIAVTPNGGLVYVINQTSGTIAGFLGGSLTPVTVSPFVTGPTPTDIRIDPSGLYVFVLCQGVLPSIWVYAINYSTGGLATVSGSPFPVAGVGTPTYLGVDPLNRFVWTGGGSQVSVFSLDVLTGVLSAAPGNTFAITGGGSALSLTVDPSGQLAFLSMSGGSISTLAVQADGTLTGPTLASTVALARVRTRGATPSAVALVQSTASVLRTPSFAYVGSSAGLSGFSLTAGTGQLTPLGGSPFVAGTAFNSVTVDPYGRFAYASTTSVPSAPLGQFTISGGTLTAIAAPPSIANATGILADPSGQYVLVASGAGAVSSYSIAPLTGALTAVNSVPFAGPQTLLADPLGSFVLTTGGGTLTLVPVDAATGTVGAPSAVAAPGGPVAAAVVSPTGLGAFLGYTSNHLGFASIASPAVVVGSATLTAIPPVGNIVSLAMDSSGLLLYVAVDSGSILIYSVDPTTPTTLTLQNAVLTSPGASIPLSTDPSGSFLYASPSGNGSLWSYVPGGFGGTQLLTVPGTPIVVGTSPSAAAVAPIIQ